MAKTLFPKARGVGRSLLVLPRKWSTCLPRTEQTVHSHFSQVLAFALKDLEDPAMNLPVHGECDGVNYISVEDYICKI